MVMVRARIEGAPRMAATRLRGGDIVDDGRVADCGAGAMADRGAEHLAAATSREFWRHAI